MLFASIGLVPELLIFIFAVVALFLACIKRKTVHVFLAVAFTAACRFLVAQPDLAQDSINHLGFAEQQVMRIRGAVSSFPQYQPYRSGTSGNWEFPLSVQCIETSNGWKTVSGKIDVKVVSAPSHLGLQYGDYIEANGRVLRNRFPGRNQHILNLRDSDCMLIEAAGVGSPVQWGRAWRNSVARSLELGLDDFPLHESVLKALVLGYREEIPSDVISVFRRTGAMHIFAISGLHVGIVAFLLAFVLKTLGIPRDKFGLLLIPLLALYVISTGMKPSAVRALLMAAIFILAPLFRRKPDIPTSVAIAAILLLVFQPLEIRSAGFIFSFTVVAFLVMVFSRVPAHWLQGSWIRVYTISLFITSFAAGLASIPLTALLFGTFSPIAFVGNIIVVPLTFCIVLCGWLSILLPFVAHIFNHAAVVFIHLMLLCVQWLDTLPGSSWKVAPPSLLSVLLWYGSLIALFAVCSNARQRLAAVGMAIVAVLLVLVA